MAILQGKLSSRLPLLLLALRLVSMASALRVLASPLHLEYHHGPLLAGPQPIKLFLTFYGDFEPYERSTLKAFLSSLNPYSHKRSLRGTLFPVMEGPSVASWWSLTQHYTDLEGHHVSQRVELAEEADENYSLGKHLTASDMASLARSSVEFPSAEMANDFSIIFTSADVTVDGFCMHSCGGHSLAHSAVGNGGSRHGDASFGHGMVPYLWVGNPKQQCPGFCAWPFAKQQYGPPVEPLKAPNGVGVDGMIISLAKLLVSTATNAAGNGFYQGDVASVGLDAGGVCTGRFGVGAYPGYPGKLMQNSTSGASYNMEGRQREQFLVPWIWNPALGTCVGQP